MNSKNERAELAADQRLGVGNVVTTLVERGTGLDTPTLTFDTDVDGHPAWQALSLAALGDRVAARAAALHALGIRPRDPVAVWVTNGADQVLGYLALARIGAIPALVNGRLPAEQAAEYIRRLRAVAVVADSPHQDALTAAGTTAPSFVDPATLGKGDPAQAPAPYRHHAGEPVVITHSSGTTGLPKAVTHSHHSLFAAIRHRLSLPKGQGLDRMLGALPSAHAATVIAVNLALTNRAQLAVLSAQSGPVVLDAIEAWQPQSVLGFAAVWSELAGEDLSSRDLASVRTWWNTGDCAHEAHIRRLVAVGSRETVTAQGRVRRTGSFFVDGLGSSEMGHSQFFITHTPDTDRYGRCIGKPHAFSDVAVVGDDGERLGAGQVGQLAISAPTLSLGYWNDSVTTYRTRKDGYFLTGDLVRHDEDGYYYHVDRAVDAVDVGDGTRLYTMLCEERVLARCADVLECTVVAVPSDGGAVTSVLLVLDPKADRGTDRTAEVLAALEPHVARTVERVVVVDPDRLPLGATGKVRKFLLRQRFLDGELLGRETTGSRVAVR
ncbi:class I adenylate-forming enzyme family protein [Streptomyces sp. DH41]|uniref:class I adenylate-forming enzyme family protein n=1 Tax=Streptomyces sp. DH41 TaxID=3040125 RepID=UPI0024436588|nr:class I adenylate-forming enzyme family protein [Streptomyces sp. DH41]MDG9722607.1 class I adenylate-forming enzyme family protein [Streptomyces sp. DH41]